MLVIKRRVGERFYIDHKGERLEIVIAEARGSVVRVGLEGSRAWSITRKELEQGNGGPRH